MQGWARDAFTTMAMADYPYPANFLGGLPAFPVNAACDKMTGDENRMTALANAAGMLLLPPYLSSYIIFSLSLSLPPQVYYTMALVSCPALILMQNMLNAVMQQVVVLGMMH